MTVQAEVQSVGALPGDFSNWMPDIEPLQSRPAAENKAEAVNDGVAQMSVVERR